MKLSISIREINGYVVIKAIYGDGLIYEDEFVTFFKKNLSVRDSYSMEKHETKGVRLTLSMKEGVEEQND